MKQKKLIPLETERDEVDYVILSIVAKIVSSMNRNILYK